jgi:tetratricopeptide (TPR) repeat protein
MKLYVPDELVAESSSRSSALAIDQIVELAWHLRQRDTAKALELALAAERLLWSHSGTALTAGLRGRICLVRAEAAWLNARFEFAETQFEAAIAHFQLANDPVGLGDALLLGSLLAYDRGETEQRRDRLRRAAALYEAEHDPERTLIALGWGALTESFGGAFEPLERAEKALASSDLPPPATVLGLLNFARAQLAFLAGDYGAARDGFHQASRDLRGNGLVRQAISAIVNASIATGNLNDFETQAEIVEDALALARVTGWPQSLGACLYCLGDAHHSLGRLDFARAAFIDARKHLLALPSSRPYVTVTTFLAEVTLRLGLGAEALEVFEDARAAAERGGHRELLPRVLAGLAACLSRLDRAQEALQTAEQALRASEGRDLVTERLALLTLARIHRVHPLAAPEGVSGSSASLHYLEKIWSLQASNPEWTPDDEILGEFAAAWEHADDLPRALTYERRRIGALARQGTRRAEQHVAATQARHEALTARLEADHQRRLLESERRRQMVLEQLSMIGQEITASLDAVDILRALDHHVRAMLDAPALSIWLCADGVLTPAFSHEDGTPIRGRAIPLDDARSIQACAAREQREILTEHMSGEAHHSRVPRTGTFLTELIVPLTVGARTLGVISIQSSRAHAYGDQERLIFRNICAYAAIALANASNYEQLSASHEKLVAAQAELERLANFDALTGLHNRRHFMTAAQAEIARARRASSCSTSIISSALTIPMAIRRETWRCGR